MLSLFREIIRASTSPRTIGVWVAVTGILTLTGPFGSFNVRPFWQNLIYWAIIVGASIPVAHFCRIIVSRFVAFDAVCKFDFAFIGFLTVIYTPFVIWFTEFSFAEAANLPAPPLMALYVALATGMTCLVRRQILSIEAKPYFAPQTPSFDPRLMQRLPDGFAGPIMRLTSRDHFVDVVGSTETVSVRMRFQDAIAEMDGVKGYCTHRSHWVTAVAIKGAEKARGRVALRLVNNDLVPVSRKYRPELERVGIV